MDINGSWDKVIWGYWKRFKHMNLITCICQIMYKTYTGLVLTRDSASQWPIVLCRTDLWGQTLSVNCKSHGLLYFTRLSCRWSTSGCTVPSGVLVSGRLMWWTWRVQIWSNRWSARRAATPFGRICHTGKSTETWEDKRMDFMWSMHLTHTSHVVETLRIIFKLWFSLSLCLEARVLSGTVSAVLWILKCWNWRRWRRTRPSFTRSCLISCSAWSFCVCAVTTRAPSTTWHLSFTNLVLKVRVGTYAYGDDKTAL